MAAGTDVLVPACLSVVSEYRETGLGHTLVCLCPVFVCKMGVMLLPISIRFLGIEIELDCLMSA